MLVEHGGKITTGNVSSSHVDVILREWKGDHLDAGVHRSDVETLIERESVCVR